MKLSMSTLEFDHISVQAGEKKVVQDVSFTLRSGELAVLMGSNGSGKSSLVNAVMGHPAYQVTAGKLLLDGADVVHKPTEYKAQQGMFLSLQHIPRIEGVTLATFLHKIHCTKVCQETPILEYYLALREVIRGYGISDALLDRPLSAGLSGGEKKLSEALQLAVLKPRFAFLDEIDSGVDIDALKSVFKVIARLQKEGTGFLVISHHPSLLEYVSPDQVYVMHQGTIGTRGEKGLVEAILKDGYAVHIS